jgi:uncharacterized protein (TIRG00374 family)
MAFISVAVPSAGISGVAMRVHLLRRYGYRPEEALFSMVVETVLELNALVSVAIVGVAYLVEIGRLQQGNFIFMVRFVRIWNRFGKRFRNIEETYIEERLTFFQSNLNQYQNSVLWKLPLSAYGKVFLDVLCLGACFLLFGYQIPPSTLFIGYGLVLTFGGLGALPGGLAMTDAMVPIIFSFLGVPGSVAIAAGLTYRLIAYWLVRFVGYISWIVVERRTKPT